MGSFLFMSLPKGNRLPLDNNRRTLLGGVSYLDSNVSVPGTFDPATGAQLVSIIEGGRAPNSIITSQTTTVAGDLPNLLVDYANAAHIDLSIQYFSDISKGFNGWQHQYDTTGRPGITLTEEARLGNYALELHSDAVASQSAWCRKGWRIPDNVSKIIYGCYFTMHAQNANNPLAVVFDIDTQTASGTNRSYFSVRYLNYDTQARNKWQVNTGTAVSQTFTDVTSGAMTIPWNESVKPMLNYVMVVIDYTNKAYEKLYSNGNVYTLTGSPTLATSLPSFDQGLVHIMRIENRSNSSEEGIMTIETPFLAWGF